MSPNTPVDHQVKTAHGSVVVAEYGDPDGLPVWYFHGMPGCRLEGALLDLEARVQGIRLLCPDRAGIGGTSFRPVAELGAHVDEVMTAMNALASTGPTALLGWSSGGPLALAVSRQLAARCNGLHVVSSYTHFAEFPAADALMLGHDRPAPFVLGRLPGSLRWFVQALYTAEQLAPSLYLQLVRRLCAPSDQRVFDQPEVARLTLASHRECFRQGGQGVHQDLRLQYLPWGFSLAEVATPVTLWQGEDDTLVPPAMAMHLHRSLPCSVLETIPAAGHLMLFDRAVQRVLFRRIRQAWPTEAAA